MTIRQQPFKILLKHNANIFLQKQGWKLCGAIADEQPRQY
jgi:hypothetical protein